MSEQLRIEFPSVCPNKHPNQTADESVSYEALDIQLADLMQELNFDQHAKQNKEQNKEQNAEQKQLLKYFTLEISKHTREGQITFPCTNSQQRELFKTKVVGGAGDYKPLIIENGYLYLRRYWQYQQQLADNIISRLGTIKREDTNDRNQWIKERLCYFFEKDSLKGETNWQQVAAERALNKDFLIISGGPGTGKTTTITRILALLIEQHLQSSNKEGGAIQRPCSAQVSNALKVLIAAPTGKAAIRMLDSIRIAQADLDLPKDVLEQMPIQASTIHKLLGYKHQSVYFKHNKVNPLNADVVLIDEASMIDIALMSKLVEAVPAHAKLILIGDKDQLSSVETGSVFADLCEGLKHEKGLGKRGGNLVTLQKNWRFSKDSGIGQLAKASNQGETKKVIEILKDESKSECSLIEPTILANNRIPENLFAPWKNYFNVLDNSDSSMVEIFKAFNQYRILCALRRGLNGSNILSNRIETALQKSGFINLGRSQNKRWYHGRPVMITQNSYSKGLFNGDTGITLIRNGETRVYFPDAEEGQYKSFAPVRLPAHETNWAMTIHKSQGSEFDQVTLILPHEVMPLLTRQLIYTGVTRAMKQVRIIASESVLAAGVKTEVVQATRIADYL
ncbi:MAG: exodeoxyribonuclease V subunit alpha [Cocleimonas sp.]